MEGLATPNASARRSAPSLLTRPMFERLVTPTSSLNRRSRQASPRSSSPSSRSFNSSPPPSRRSCHPRVCSDVSTLASLDRPAVIRRGGTLPEFMQLYYLRLNFQPTESTLVPQQDAMRARIPCWPRGSLCLSPPATIARIQKHAKLFVDTFDSVINRILDAYEKTLRRSETTISSQVETLEAKDTVIGRDSIGTATRFEHGGFARFKQAQAKSSNGLSDRRTYGRVKRAAVAGASGTHGNGDADVPLLFATIPP